jgi:hypothetical protein
MVSCGRVTHRSASRPVARMDAWVASVTDCESAIRRRGRNPFHGAFDAESDGSVGIYSDGSLDLEDGQEFPTASWRRMMILLPAVPQVTLEIPSRGRMHVFLCRRTLGVRFEDVIQAALRCIDILDVPAVSCSIMREPRLVVSQGLSQIEYCAIRSM